MDPVTIMLATMVSIIILESAIIWRIICLEDGQKELLGPLAEALIYTDEEGKEHNVLHMTLIQLATISAIAEKMAPTMQMANKVAGGMNPIMALISPDDKPKEMFQKAMTGFIMSKLQGGTPNSPTNGLG
jgi:hypothetical protein